MLKRLRTGTILGVALLAAQSGFAHNHNSDAALGRIEREVRRELAGLPFHSVFDSFSFRVEGDTVTLLGKVTRPTLKSDAEAVTRKVEGVENVVNRIQLLPLSPHDDRLRVALYRAIYGHSALETFALRAIPPIRILVENGAVTLEGVVANEMQKNVAGAQANGVAGVFSVTNNLRLDSET